MGRQSAVIKFDFNTKKIIKDTASGLKPSTADLNQVPDGWILASNNEYDKKLNQNDMGKWIIYFKEDENKVDQIWEKVVSAVKSGHFMMAEVSIKSERFPAQAILIYTKDITDQEEIFQIHSTMEALGIIGSTDNIKYKSEMATLRNLNEVMYISKNVRSNKKLFAFDFDLTLTLSHTYPDNSLFDKNRKKRKDPAFIDSISDQQIWDNLRNPYETRFLMKNIIEKGHKLTIVTQHDNVAWVKRNLTILLGESLSDLVDKIDIIALQASPYDEKYGGNKELAINDLMSSNKIEYGVLIDDDINKKPKNSSNIKFIHAETKSVPQNNEETLHNGDAYLLDVAKHVGLSRITMSEVMACQLLKVMTKTAGQLIFDLNSNIASKPLNYIEVDAQLESLHKIRDNLDGLIEFRADVKKKPRSNVGFLFQKNVNKNQVAKYARKFHKNLFNIELEYLKTIIHEKNGSYPNNSAGYFMLESAKTILKDIESCNFDFDFATRALHTVRLAIQKPSVENANHVRKIARRVDGDARWKKVSGGMMMLSGIITIAVSGLVIAGALFCAMPTVGLSLSALFPGGTLFCDGAELVSDGASMIVDAKQTTLSRELCIFSEKVEKSAKNNNAQSLKNDEEISLLPQNGK